MIVFQNKILQRKELKKNEQISFKTIFNNIIYQGTFCFQNF